MLLKRPRSTLSAITPPPRYAVMVAWLALPIGVGIIGISMWWASKVTDPCCNGAFHLVLGRRVDGARPRQSPGDAPGSEPIRAGEPTGGDRRADGAAEGAGLSRWPRLFR